MSKSVLLVEDSGSFRAVVKIGLERAGYSVLEACNGEEACTLLDGRSIDLVISDLNMPVMDGITFIRTIRRTEYQSVPVIVLTTESESKKERSDLDIEIQGWVTKPFLPSQLIDAVQKVCPL